MQLRSLLLGLALATLAVGCGSGDSATGETGNTASNAPASKSPATGEDLAGTWTDASGNTFEFLKDGSFVQHTKTDLYNITTRGRYEQDGNKIAFTAKPPDLKAIKPKDQPAADAAMLKAANAPDVTAHGNVEFKGKDEIELSQDAPASAGPDAKPIRLTLKRKS